MSPFIYPHRANGRGSKPRLRKWACHEPGCHETARGWASIPIAPECPLHGVCMEEDR